MILSLQVDRHDWTVKLNGHTWNSHSK